MTLQSALVPAALALTVATGLAQSTPPPKPDGQWKKVQLTEHFWAEGACAGDVDKDGHVDILSGPYWYAGPDFKKRYTIYPDVKTSKIKVDGAEKEIPGFAGALSGRNEYSDNFISYTYDFNGDGWLDYLVIGFPGAKTTWYENPKGSKDDPWEAHVAFDVTDNESPMFVDITGDGKPELVCMSGGHVGYAEFDPKKPGEKWKWHPVSPKGQYQKFTHGIGYGDVNGDGRIDILESTGWWEQPASLEGDPVWKKHDAEFGGGGAQMYAYDVNGDGKSDIITSLQAHGYGVAWFEQTDDGGVVGWNRHFITGSDKQPGETGIVFSQPHAVDLVDMNGDGLKDIVTGKRFWAHGPGGDAEPNAPAVLYWFELKREGGKAKWTPHFIDGDSGVGTQVMATDLNNDKKLDVVVGNKKGVFALIRQ